MTTTRSQPTLDTNAARVARRRTGIPFARATAYVLQRYSLVLLWAVMVVLFLLLLPNGVDLANASRAVLGQQTPVVFLGLAVIVTIAVGEFDLSFAFVYGLAGTAFPALVVLDGWPVPLALLAALAAALLVGLINAVLVVIVGISSIVVTLGTGSVALGIALFLSNQSNVSGLDPALAQVALGRFLGLPAVFWYGVVLVIITAYVMSATPLGRSMLFVGSNPNVARLAGIPVRRVRFGAYLVAALLSGAIGIILACGVGGFSTATAQVQLMPALAAVFLGTIAVVPGRLNAIGMLIAAYFLLSGVFGLQLLGLSGWVTNVFYGAALIVAITVSLLLRRRARA
ncbi:ABC transporter permease [Actinoplanes subtropicus]|uniref:ABC transporter permease n=1 Tax=Actinoplanes subtropicus TaxID=543632 RepID=UPI0004C46607|nr:ABC transporter permease [Actinoplanes subtropicus]